MNFVLITCPNCDQLVQIYIKDFNCKIFRHGVFKSNGKPINPHCNKTTVDNYLSQNMIYGCGQPFKIIIDNSKIVVKKCEWI